MCVYFTCVGLCFLQTGDVCSHAYFLLNVSILNILLAVLESFDRLIESTAEYCSQRQIYGKSLLDNQGIQYRLAELETEVELLRSLLYRSVGMSDHWLHSTLNKYDGITNFSIGTTIYNVLKGTAL